MSKERLTFLGMHYPDEAIPELLEDTIGNLEFAGDTFQKAVIKGLSNHYSVRAVSAMLIGSFPRRFKTPSLKKYKKYSTEELKIIPFFNLTFYKKISIYYHLKRYLNNLDFSENEKIIVYSSDVSLLKAAVSIKKKHPNVHIHLIITDINEFMSPGKIATIINKFDQYIIKNLFYAINSFTVMTKYMITKLGISKPCAIVEGINSTIPMEYEYKKSDNKFVILYTGTLEKRYGILHLINAFVLLPQTINFELWICGNGDAKQVVEEYTKKDPRIVYYGLVPRVKVLELQSKANLLINPRFSTDEYTLYSFPSKTIEYLLSGTPVIMHHLPGIPKEYDSYIYYADDETDQGFANSILEVAKKPFDELIEQGKLAREFILNEKNCYKQAEKIIEVMNE